MLRRMYGGHIPELLLKAALSNYCLFLRGWRHSLGGTTSCSLVSWGAGTQDVPRASHVRLFVYTLRWPDG